MSSGSHFAPARVRAVHDVASDVRMVEIEPEGGAKPYPTGVVGLHYVRSRG